MPRDYEKKMPLEQQRRFVGRNALTMPVKRIAKEIGRSQCFVSAEMKRQGIVVPRETIEQFKKDSRFSSGLTPHNKGKKQHEYMTADQIQRTMATRFKKGNLPHNTKSDYELSLRNNKGVQSYFIRVSLGNWVPVHRWIWEQANGPIPEGDIVQFKDGNTLNFELDNLYVLDRRTQLNVNSHGGKKLPYELRKTIILINQLKDKIDEQSR